MTPEQIKEQREWLDTLTGYISEARHKAELAAVLEEAARICDAERHNLNILTTNPPQSASAVGARNLIHALRPDARAALDKLIAEAVQSEREACVEATKKEQSK